ncbi:MAG: RIP metalloprotease RseP [Pseudomonadota bacterium]
MELITSLPIVGGFLGAAIPFIIVLGIVVFVHEYGHYIVGRWCGIGAEVFSIGFGPELTGWTDKRGTRWRIAALPLGGYVKFVGDADGASRPDKAAVDQLSAEDRARSFFQASLSRRAATVAAGPVANFLLSIVVFAGLAIYGGIATDEPVVGEMPEGLQSLLPVREGDRIERVNGVEITRFSDVYDALRGADGEVALDIVRDEERLSLTSTDLNRPFIGGLRPLSPASQAGILPGDLILTVDGASITSLEEMQTRIGASEGEPVTIEVYRDDQTLSLTMTPELSDVQVEDGFEKRVIIGVTIGPVLTPLGETPDPFTALWFGVQRMLQVITGSINGLYHMIAGDVSATNLQGPIGIAQVSGESAKVGIASFIALVATISTAIGLLNLFPIPVLDGGHLVFYAIEGALGRQLAERWVSLAMSVGLALVLLLMVFATYNDLSRLF